MTFDKTKQHVANHGAPPDAFLSEMIAWAKTAPDEIFSPRPAPVNGPDLDIYAWIQPTLGPWESPLHRRAVMLEVLRVLAAFESSWRWDEGRDTTAGPEKPDEMEAGAWQVSANSRYFGADLRAISPLNPYDFQAAMKSDHALSMTYIARLLRWTIKCNGPLVRRGVDPWLRRDSVAEFMALLA